jgi:hypothetical protein
VNCFNSFSHKKEPLPVEKKVSRLPFSKQLKDKKHFPCPMNRTSVRTLPGESSEWKRRDTYAVNSFIVVSGVVGFLMLK